MKKKKLLGTGNRKISRNKYNTATFGIPAIKTCPFAGLCQHECSVDEAGSYGYDVVKNAQKRRFEESKKKDFVDNICTEITEGNFGAVRIHDSGDFYSEAYLQKWLEIARQNPDVIFYAYTKSVRYFKKDFNTWKIKLPKNFVITFSYGGKDDHLINPFKDKHALVFRNKEQITKYGYSDTSKIDDNAYKPEVKKIGLIMKPYRKKEGWTETLNKVLNLITGLRPQQKRVKKSVA